MHKRSLRAALTLIATAMVLSVLAGCSVGKPPLPVVKAGKTQIKAYQSSYCWGNTCADYADPESMLKDEPAIEVSSGADISIAFKNRSKPSTMTVKQFKDGQPTDVPFAKGKITAPTEKGVYYYGVSAWWRKGKLSKGSTSAAFAIEIK
ncbi:hypothetical protein [Paenibacillus harenae]|uniref:Lipoprotein n=1 Tax=Paenibacillus harenae TaxID=306543 RepID=A0ABT9TXF8_PAEHA|nr:hypothetical protein [Paenibacillus harenae]MDQ0111130.1 hypothetical protein [Paenibacillus harenae]